MILSHFSRTANAKDTVMKIVEYKVIASSVSAEEFNALVADALLRGWQPFGQLIIENHYYDGDTIRERYHQAMVKYEDDKK